MQAIGRISEICRYPVKSMAGESLPSAALGWHGVEGDRRFAFARRGVSGGVPWLTASKLPSLVTYIPLRDADASDGALPSRVRTPAGQELGLRSEALRLELEAAHGAPLELIEIRNGIFDDAPVSLITTATIAAIAEGAEIALDFRRFRPNLLIEAIDAQPFHDDLWVGRTIRIGEGEDAPSLAICVRDVRCVMINLDPATADSDPRILKSAVRLNANCAGVYGTVIRSGQVSRGDMLYLM